MLNICTVVSLEPVLAKGVLITTVTLQHFFSTADWNKVKIDFILFSNKDFLH